MLAASALAVGRAHAQDSIKIGVTIPITGQHASSGREVDAAVKLWLAQSSAKAGGKKVEIVVKADAGIPDNGWRIAQEFVVNDKVVALAVDAGFGLGNP